MLHLKEKYKKEVIPAMIEKFGYRNSMSVPKIEKVVVNFGFGKITAGKTSSEREKIMTNSAGSLALLTGQNPVSTKAKKSIAAFKLRKEVPIGLKTTLRGKRMFDFLERLIWIVLPRTRDFKGIPLKSIDREGSLTLGFKDYTSFPEIIVEREKGIFGLGITITTNSKQREHGFELLKLMGFPIKF
jgi:large subunit ribosomal protein L5